MSKEISVRMRMEAAEAVATDLDNAVRSASAYGQKNVAGFDESMACTAIAHTLSIWWEGLTEDQMRDKLRMLAGATIASWHNRQTGTVDPAPTQH